MNMLRRGLAGGEFVCETIDVSDVDRIHVDANANVVHIFGVESNTREDYD